MLIEEAYQQLVDTHQLTEDKAQLSAIKALDSLRQTLIEQHCSSPSILSKVIHPFNAQPIVKGLYFYGKVGRGKTMLMDLFYQHLPLERKQRIHFHRFMENVHQELNFLTIHKSAQKKLNSNPLNHIAKSWAAKVDVLCFDEFFIADIGDAMLIAGLIKALFSYKVTLVATSNSRPEALYLNGLQRERFIPTIELINQHCFVISIDGEIDHRVEQQKISAASLNNDCYNDNEQSLPYNNYVYPLEKFPNFINEKFYQYSGIKKLLPGLISINGRALSYLGKARDSIAFDFYSICTCPRSQRDYIELADKFATIFVVNVPQFNGDLVPAIVSGVEENYQRSGILLKELRHLDDEARRFIALVDELYDQGVRLIITAEVDITELYQSRQLSFEFERCQSRLFEMQSL